MASEKRQEVLALMKKRLHVREIWDCSGVTPRGIRTIAKQDAPDYAEWVEGQVCADYESMGRRRTAHKWVLTGGMLNNLLRRNGVPLQSDSWDRQKGGRPRSLSDIECNPLAAKAISMKWTPA